MAAINDLFHQELNLIAYRLHRLECHPVDIHQCQPDGAESAGAGLILKAGGIVHIPGLGFVPLENGGLYRIHSFNNHDGLQWIVHDGDLITFAASVSSLFYHLEDEPADLDSDGGDSRVKAHQYVLDKMQKGKVAGTCLTAANSFAIFCMSLEIEAVVWEFESYSTPYSPASSHAMTEIRDPLNGHRFLVDVDRKSVFADEDGRLLTCADFVERACTDRPIAVQRISNTRYAGFGRARRLPVAMDFVNELIDCGGTDYQEQIAAIIGRSELVRGSRYYGAQQQILLPGTAQKAIDALKGMPPDQYPPEQLESLARLPELEF